VRAIHRLILRSRAQRGVSKDGAAACFETPASGGLLSMRPYYRPAIRSAISTMVLR